MSSFRKTRNLLIISILTIISACSRPDLEQVLAGVDTLEIIFYAEKNQPADTVWVRDKSHIKHLIWEVETKDAPLFKCGYQGKLNFRKTRVNALILEAEFNLNADCAHITFLYQNKIYARRLNADGVAFLQLARKYKEALNSMEISQRK